MIDPGVTLHPILMNPKAITALLSWICALSLFAAETPSPALLVLNKTDLTLAIVDPSTLKIVATAPTGQDPHEVIASADGKLAFISNYGGFGTGFQTLGVVDLVTQKALASVELPGLRAPHGITQAEGKIYFTAEANRAIARYDPVARQIDWIFGSGQNRTHMIVVSKDANQIFTSNVNSNTVSIIERASVAGAGGRAGGARGGAANEWNVTHVSVGRGPEGFDVAPDSKELWAANSGDGTVSIVDVAQKTVSQTINVGTAASNRLKITPDGKLALISDLRGNQLVVIDVAKREERKRIPLGAGATGILIQPDGARAFVAVSTQNALAVIDLKTLEVTGRIDIGRNPDGMAWAVRN